MKRSVVVPTSTLSAAGIQAITQERQNCTGPQLGTWALQSYTSKDLITGAKTELLGARPSGYISYGPDCRMFAVLVRDGRKAPKCLVPTDGERVDLYDGFAAYAGTYSIEGDTISHHIDASWNQSWTGTTQVRQFRIEGKTLYIKTLPANNALTGKKSSSVLVWQRVE